MYLDLICKMSLHEILMSCPLGKMSQQLLLFLSVGTFFSSIYSQSFLFYLTIFRRKSSCLFILLSAVGHLLTRLSSIIGFYWSTLLLKSTIKYTHTYHIF